MEITGYKNEEKDPTDHTTLEGIKFKDGAGDEHKMLVKWKNVGTSDKPSKEVVGVAVDKKHMNELSVWRELGWRIRRAQGSHARKAQGMGTLLLCVRTEEDH